MFYSVVHTYKVVDKEYQFSHKSTCPTVFQDIFNISLGEYLQWFFLVVEMLHSVTLLWVQYMNIANYDNSTGIVNTSLQLELIGNSFKHDRIPEYNIQPCTNSVRMPLNDS